MIKLSKSAAAQSAPSVRLAPTLSLVFFLSGCSALMFETIWFRVASTVLGGSVWSAAVVLAAFMSGLALGNAGMAAWGRRITDPLTAYAIAEVAIAIGGAAAVVLLPGAIPALLGLLVEDYSHPVGLLAARFSIAFAFFMVPATAMGATLPLLARALNRDSPSYGAAIGRLYGWNTLGAVAGALAAELAFIALLGLRSTALLASTLNLAAAVIVIRAFGRSAVGAREGANARTRLAAGELAWLVLPFLAGALLLALEVIWFRYLMLAHDGSSQIFAVMLALVLAGIALGSLLAVKLEFAGDRLDTLIAAVPLLAGGCVVLGFSLFHAWFTYDPFAFAHDVPLFAAAAAVLMLPTSVLSGMLFPLYGERLYRANANATLSAGTLTFANTVGAAMGSAVAAFGLLPALGVERSLLVLALGYVVISLLGVALTARVRIRRFAVGLGAAAALVLVFPYGSVDFAYRMLAANKFRGSETIAIREGVNETVQYLRHDYLGQPLYHRLVTNGHSMSSTRKLAQRYMKLFVYLPYALREPFDDALLISYGVGNTAAAMVRIPQINTVDVVDVSADTIRLSALAYPNAGASPLEDPRVKVYIEDGRFYLQTTNRSYDLITGEPPPPKMAGVVNLYTREYFELIRARLKAGGIATYWLPTHSLHPGDALAITKAFCLVFPDCSMWIGNAHEFMLMGSHGGIPSPSRELFERPWTTPSTGADLASLALELPEQLGALFVADPATLTALTRDVEPLVDNHPHRLDPSNVGLREFSELYAFLHDVARREATFAASAYIAVLIPPEYATASQRYFAFENFFNPLEYAGPGYTGWDELVDALESSPLSELPLWMVGSGTAEQRILDDRLRRQPPGAELSAAIGGRHLARREYRQAAGALAQALATAAPGEVETRTVHLYLIATALAGDHAAIRDFGGSRPDLYRKAAPEFVPWLSARFGLDPP